jgi:small-conductance mechanosensitive channel
MEQIVQYGLDAVGIAVIVVIGVFTFKLARRGLSSAAAREKMSDPLRALALGFAKWAVIVVVALLSLQQAGVEVTSIWAGLLTIMAMVAVGFIAVWSIISNIFCSLMMLIFAPFRIGDEIEIIETTGGSGLRGTVRSVNPMFTCIDEAGEGGINLVQVPNNVFFQKTIRRWKGTATSGVDESLFEKKKTAADA